MPDCGICRTIDKALKSFASFCALKQHRREQIYPVAGNHDASPGDAESSRGKPANWWFRKWVDPLSENPNFSGVEAARRPYPIEGTWERYSFRVGNLRFLMMSDRNDLPYPVGRRETGGGSPAGAVTSDTFAWWQHEVEAAGDDIVISCHHHMLRETTVASGDYEGVSRYPDGRWRHGRYHGVDGVPEGASYLYFIDDEPKAQKFEAYLAANPGAVDLWLGGHTHTFPEDVVNGRSHVETKWGTHFINCAQLSKYHSFVTCPPMSRHFIFTPGSRQVRVPLLLARRQFCCAGVVCARRARAGAERAISSAAVTGADPRLSLRRSGFSLWVFSFDRKYKICFRVLFESKRDYIKPNLKHRAWNNCFAEQY